MRITEEGGFAYVSSAGTSGRRRQRGRWRGSSFTRGHGTRWSRPVACLHMAELRSGTGDHREAFRTLDMGLIMGGPLLRPDLDAAVERIMATSGEGEVEGSDTRDYAEWWKKEFSKNWDLTEVLRVLPSRSLSCRIVEKRPPLSLETFIRDYFLCDSPVIIGGYIDHWPARTK